MSGVFLTSCNVFFPMFGRAARLKAYSRSSSGSDFIRTTSTRLILNQRKPAEVAPRRRRKNSVLRTATLFSFSPRVTFVGIASKISQISYSEKLVQLYLPAAPIPLPFFGEESKTRLAFVYSASTRVFHVHMISVARAFQDRFLHHLKIPLPTPADFIWVV